MHQLWRRSIIIARARAQGSRSFTFWRQRLQQKQAPVEDPSAIDRIESRLPKFLLRFTRPLRDAPVSHITAFLILHEITAVVPLFGLVAFFHYSNWMPPYISEGALVREGTERFGKWLRKRGWIDAQDDRKSRWFGRGETGVKLVGEFATAYAITKVLLPLRLPFSVWLTPWFARWTTLPTFGLVKRTFQSRKAVKAAKAGEPAGVPTQAVSQKPPSSISKSSSG